MRIIVLGSAAGGGFPQWNCACSNCARARAGDPAARPRTQSSLAVSADGQAWFLLNASPDLRQQITATPALHPRRAVRDSPIRGVILTNAEVDHVAGLLTLRERQPFSLYASAEVHAVLKANQMFDVLSPDLVARRTIRFGERVLLDESSGLALEPFRVPGKMALYLESGLRPEDSPPVEDSIGLRLFDLSGTGFFYVPGCTAVTADLKARLSGAALVFFDGTLWRDDEMIEAGLSAKSGQRMGHISISSEGGSMAALAEAGIRRKIFTHLNNSNPVLIDDSPERAAVEAAGWEVAYDGMEIRL